MPNIMSIEEIVTMLRQQADLRAPENDEAGILRMFADNIEDAVKSLNNTGWDGWECPTSPTGRCDYTQEDGIIDLDDCRYCHQPEERK